MCALDSKYKIHDNYILKILNETYDLNTQNNSRLTALMLALGSDVECFYKRSEVILIEILSKQLDINIEDNWGRNALMFALFNRKHHVTDRTMTRIFDMKPNVRKICLLNPNILNNGVEHFMKFLVVRNWNVTKKVPIRENDRVRIVELYREQQNQ
jgi:ankyrin repeat protein